MSSEMVNLPDETLEYPFRQALGLRAPSIELRAEWLKAPSATEGSGLILSGALNPDSKIGDGAVERIKPSSSFPAAERRDERILNFILNFFLATQSKII